MSQTQTLDVKTGFHFPILSDNNLETSRTLDVHICRMRWNDWRCSSQPRNARFCAAKNSSYTPPSFGSTRHRYGTGMVPYRHNSLVFAALADLFTKNKKREVEPNADHHDDHENFLRVFDCGSLRIAALLRLGEQQQQQRLRRKCLVLVAAALDAHENRREPQFGRVFGQDEFIVFGQDELFVILGQDELGQVQ